MTIYADRNLIGICEIFFVRAFLRCSIILTFVCLICPFYLRQLLTLMSYGHYNFYGVVINDKLLRFRLNSPPRCTTSPRPSHAMGIHFTSCSTENNQPIKAFVAPPPLGHRPPTWFSPGPESISPTVSSCIQFLWRLLPDRGATCFPVVLFSFPLWSLGSRLRLVV